MQRKRPAIPVPKMTMAENRLQVRELREVGDNVIG
jgi:hypothetical protein